MKEKIRVFIVGVIIGMIIVTTGVFAKNGGIWKELMYNNIKVTLNNNTVETTDASGNYVEPFIIDGTTYLPVRAVSSALGLYVNWDSNTNTVKLSTEKENNIKYSDFNGSYSGGGVQVSGEKYKIGEWRATITNVSEESLNLSFSQSESDYYIDNMILKKQANGDYYGVGNSTWGTSYITIWLETPQKISLTVLGNADQTGTEYLYK